MRLGRVSAAAAVIATATVVAWAMAGPALAEAPVAQIQTLAGGGTCSGSVASGGRCDNTAAINVPIGHARWVAEMPNPTGALSGAGFLYVDAENNMVRFVSPSGKVTTVAGNGTTVDAPDGTLAVDSGLDGPVSVAPLANGGFLITEYNGSVVRMVSPGTPATATITTIAGTGVPGTNGGSGPATATQLNYPTDAEPLPQTEQDVLAQVPPPVLIADAYNNRVRLVSAATPGATMTTIAGGGACNDATTSCDGRTAGDVALDRPVSVSPTQDANGNPTGYVIDEYDASAVRKVSAVSAGGTFSTVAGVAGSSGYSGDGGPATSAELNRPQDAIALTDGSVLIADSGNNRVRQVSATGTITTVAGNGLATFAGDGGVATAASLQNPVSIASIQPGSFLIADEDNNVVRGVLFPPVTTPNLLPATPGGNNGWFISTVHFDTFSSTTGVLTGCQLDGKPPPSFFYLYSPCPLVSPDQSIGLVVDGVYTVYFASEDRYGDAEPVQSIQIKIDTTPPTIACNPRTAVVPYRSPQPGVIAVVRDATSGPVSPWIIQRAGTKPVGTYQRTLTGVDMAGNESEPIVCSYRIRPAAFDPQPALDARFAPGRRITAVRRLVITKVPPQASVSLACRGRGCTFSTKGGPRRGRRRVLTPLLAKLRLAPGARLTVSVTERNYVSRVWTFTIRSRRPPIGRVG